MANTAGQFWAKVDSSGDHDACWPWLEYKNVWGYGMCRWLREKRLAHRVAMEIAIGKPPPAELCVCHQCDNPACCNPKHLWLGTHADNSADRDRKHRRKAPRGMTNGNAKLTKQQASEIWHLAHARINQRYLAKEYGVTQSCVMLIHTGRNWPEVQPRVH